MKRRKQERERKEVRECVVGRERRVTVLVRESVHVSEYVCKRERERERGRRKEREKDEVQPVHSPRSLSADTYVHLRALDLPIPQC